jgi:hypothetical protein
METPTFFNSFPVGLHLNSYSRNFHKKTSIMNASILTDLQTKHYPNRSLQYYCYTNLIGARFKFIIFEHGHKHQEVEITMFIVFRMFGLSRPRPSFKSKTISVDWQHFYYSISRSQGSAQILTSDYWFDIVHHPVFILKHCSVYFSTHNILETGFCLRLPVKPTQSGPIDRASPYLQTPVAASRWGI